MAERATSVDRPLRDHPFPAIASLGAAAALGFGAAFLVADRKTRASPARLATGGALASAGVATAFSLLGAILNDDRVVKLDRHLHNYFRQHRNAAQKRAVHATTVVGSPWSTTALALAAAVYADRRHDRRAAVAILSSVAGSALLSDVLKGLVQRERPSEGAREEDEYSFPSGHTLMAASLYTLLAYLLVVDDDLGAWRFAAAGTVTALTPWTAFSRMYLGMHWPSDTIASAALATAWDAVLITFLRS